MKEKIIENKEEIREIIMYLIMGVATTAVNWVSYSVLALIMHTNATIFGLDVDILVANVTSWTIAVIFAYVTNKIFVFRSYSWERKLVVKEATMFISARLATGFLEWFGVPALVKWGLDQSLFGIKGSVSKITVSIVVVLLNYVFSKLIIFKKEDPDKEEENEQ